MSGETLGSDPVEEVLNDGNQSDEPNKAGDNGRASGDDHGGETVKVRVTVSVPEELADRLRNAVYWTASDVTMTRLATEGIRDALQKIEENRNDGEPFPPRDRELQGGRPVE